MDKRVILSVAGSGKTSLIVGKLSVESKALILTYTENNLANLRQKILEKFGRIPERVKVMSYFNFLYSFCYKPFLMIRFPAKGIRWDNPSDFTMRLKRSDPRYYLDYSARLYHNRLAKLLEVNGVFPHINQRVEKYFENIFVDEVQDFAGHDFNLLMHICQSSINVILVGDFFQHTFDTSRDGAVNKNL